MARKAFSSFVTAGALVAILLVPGTALSHPRGGGVVPFIAGALTGGLMVAAHSAAVSPWYAGGTYYTPSYYSAPRAYYYERASVPVMYHDQWNPRVQIQQGAGMYRGGDYDYYGGYEAAAPQRPSVQQFYYPQQQPTAGTQQPGTMTHACWQASDGYWYCNANTERYATCTDSGQGRYQCWYKDVRWRVSAPTAPSTPPLAAPVRQPAKRFNRGVTPDLRVWPRPRS